MNKKIFFLLLILFCSCQTQDKRVTDNSTNEAPLPNNSETQKNDSANCKKCDTVIIETAAERWDKLTDTQVEQFLCSFDKKCKLYQKYKNSGATYEKIAFEMLIVQLDRHLSTCTKLFDTNKDIDFAYILSLLQNVAGHDLPWPSIVSQLNKKKSLTTNEQKIVETIKKSETDNKKMHGIK